MSAASDFKGEFQGVDWDTLDVPGLLSVVARALGKEVANPSAEDLCFEILKLRADLEDVAQAHQEPVRPILDALRAFLSPKAPVFPPAKLRLFPQTFEREEPYILAPGEAADRTPNPHLPFLEQQLQFRLLGAVEQFGSIAHQLDRLGTREEGGTFLEAFQEMWSDAQTAAFARLLKGCAWA